jgi:heme-degrading monooxygenase HmoA
VIARTWRGVTRADAADAYLAYLKKTGLADYRATPGNRGVIVQRAIDGDRAIFELTTFWESEQAIARFAGDDISVARYYPEDDRFLLERPRHVTHAKVVHFDVSDE